MATGMQLRDMLAALRAETGKSQSGAMGTAERDTLVYLLRSRQEHIYAEHDWPFLLVDRDIPLLTGSRFYAFPTDMAFDYVNAAWAREGSPPGTWLPVYWGVGPEEYNGSDSDAGETSWPVRKWHVRDGGLEVWPNPSQPGTLRLRGRRALAPLVDDDDVSTLDGQVIVLFAAAEVLARQKTEDASLKLAKAQRLLRSILARQGANKSTPLIIGGGPPPGPGGAARPPIRAPR